MLQVRRVGAVGVPASSVADDSVVDVDEVAGDRSVTVDRRALSAQDGGDPGGHDGRVVGRWVLARPEDVEETEGDGRDPAMLAEDVEIVLGGKLARAVR